MRIAESREVPRFTKAVRPGYYHAGPDHDIKIETIGLRPGEKLREERVGDGETLAPTEKPMILAVQLAMSPETHRLQELWNRLWKAARLTT